MANRKRPPIPAIVLLVLVLVGAGVGWWWVTTHPASTQQTASGVVESREYQVATVLAGRVTAVKVSEGDVVTAGQVLVTLDAAALDLQVKQAQAGVDAAQATLKQAKDDGKSSAEIASDAARVTQAQAAVSLAGVQRDYATIKAPHAGTVVAVTTNVGQSASPGKTLITLVDTADTFLRVFVPEQQLGGVKVGQSARVTTDAGQSFAGTVTYIASEAEFTPNNVETKDQRVKLVYEVRVTVPDTAGVLKPGLPADVAFS